MPFRANSLCRLCMVTSLHLWLDSITGIMRADCCGEGSVVRGSEKGPHARHAQTEVPRSLAGIDLFAYLDEPSRQAFERRCAWRRWTPGEQIIDRETLSTDVY